MDEDMCQPTSARTCHVDRLRVNAAALGDLAECLNLTELTRSPLSPFTQSVTAKRHLSDAPWSSLA